MDYTIQKIVCGAYQENAYLLCRDGRDDCVLIDPGDDLTALRRAVAASGKKLCAMLLTHGHFDHMLSAQPLQAETDAPVYVHALDRDMLCDASKNAYDAMCSSQISPNYLETQLYGAEIDVGGICLQVIHTPGHTQGSVCLYDRENALLFSGDTLFCAGFGRVDLFGGSPREMRSSLRALFALPQDTRVLPGHGIETTLMNERARYNI